MRYAQRFKCLALLLAQTVAFTQQQSHSYPCLVTHDMFQRTGECLAYTIGRILDRCVCLRVKHGHFLISCNAKGLAVLPHP